MTSLLENVWGCLLPTVKMLSFLTELLVPLQSQANLLLQLHFIILFPIVHSLWSSWVHIIPWHTLFCLVQAAPFVWNAFPSLLLLTNFSLSFKTSCSPFVKLSWALLLPVLFQCSHKISIVYYSIHLVHFNCLHRCLLWLFLDSFEDRDQLILISVLWHLNNAWHSL